MTALDLRSSVRSAVVSNTYRDSVDNNHFYLNLSMAACKASLDAAHGIEASTFVTAMARNGVEFGIRVSGAGDDWFTAASTVPVGLYFAGFGPDDANPEHGRNGTDHACAERRVRATEPELCRHADRH